MSYAGSGLGALGQLLGVGGGVVLLGLLAWGFYRHLRRQGKWQCPACLGKQLDWQGSGTRVVEERTIEYRTYKCVACSEHLVKEPHGRFQRLEDWNPGQPPAKAPRARLVARR